MSTIISLSQRFLYTHILLIPIVFILEGNAQLSGKPIDLDTESLPYTGEISTDGEEDWYTFRTTASDNYYRIETAAVESENQADTVIELYHSDDLLDVIAFNDNAESSYFSQITIQLEALQLYYIKVTNAENGSVGYYTINVAKTDPPTPTPTSTFTLTPTPTPTDEPMVTLIVNDPPYSAQINRIGDVDWYQFSTEDYGAYFIMETHPSSDGDILDTMIFLYGPDDQTISIEKNDDKGKNDYYSRIEISLKPHSVYYIKVIEENHDDIGAYTIDVRTDIPPTPTSSPTYPPPLPTLFTPTPTWKPSATNPPPTKEIVTLIVNDPPYTGEISWPEEIDWYKFDTDDYGHYFVIETHQSAEKDILDTWIYLYGPDDQSLYIGKNDDKSENDYFSKIELHLESYSTYYIRVIETEQNDIGYYGIDVRSVIPPTPEVDPGVDNGSGDGTDNGGHGNNGAITNTPTPTSSPTPTPIVLIVNDPPYVAQITDIGETDWYLFTTLSEDGLIYSIETHQLTDGIPTDTYIYLYGPYNQQMQIDDDDDSGEDEFYSKINRLLLPDNVYFIKVHETGNNKTGDYSIDVRAEIPPTPSPTPSPITPTPEPTLAPTPTVSPTSTNSPLVTLVVNDPPYPGEISWTGEEDWYQCYAAIPDSLYTIETHYRSGYQMLDTKIYLYGPDSQELLIMENDDQSDTNYTAMISHALITGSTYFIKVIESGNNDIGVYTIDVRTSESDVTRTPSPTPTPTSTITKLIVNAPPHEAQITEKGMDHWYQFNTYSTGTHYTIETRQFPGHDVLDTEIHLYGPDSLTHLIQEHDDIDTFNYLSRIELDLETNRTYYIKVNESGDNNIGYYTIDVRTPEIILSNEYLILTAESQGRFRLKTKDGKNLLFPGDPIIKPWSSWSTVKIDGIGYSNFSNSVLGETQTLMSLVNNSQQIRGAWQIGDIELQLNLQFTKGYTSKREDNIEILWTASNHGATSHSIGMHLILDTMILENDAALFRLLNGDEITHEAELKETEIHEYIHVIDRLMNPNLISEISFFDRQKPNLIQFVDWDSIKNSPVELQYIPNRNISFLDDSAVHVQWNPEEVKNGESVSWGLLYGLAGTDIAPTRTPDISTNTPRQILTETPSFTILPTRTWTMTPSPTNTLTLPPTKTEFPTPTESPTYFPTQTAILTHTDTPSPTNTSIPTLTQTPSFTIPPTPIWTMTLSPTDTLTPTRTKTNIPTLTETTKLPQTHTAQPTYTQTPSPTKTPRFTPTPIIQHLCTNDFSLRQFFTIPLSSKPKELISDDFNDDGYTDLLTTLPNEEKLLLFLSTGDLQQPFYEIRLSLGYQCEFISSGDINGDNLKDICALSYLDEKLTVLFSDGEGNFNEKVETTIPLYFISSSRRQQPIACADTDGDGKDEIFVVYSDNFDEIYRLSLSEYGEELIHEKVIVPEIQNHTIQMITIEHMVSRDDFVLGVITWDDRLVRFFEPANFLEYTLRATYSLEDTIDGNTMSAFQVRDADGNALHDLLILPFDGTARLYTSFAEPLAQNRVVDVDFSGVSELGAIFDDAVITDLDNDHTMDMIYISRKKGSERIVMICVVCGEQPGEFGSSVIFPIDRHSSDHANLRLEAIDIDLDGKEDLAMLDDFTNELVIFLNTSIPVEPTPKPSIQPTILPTQTPYSIDLTTKENFSLIPVGIRMADITFNVDGTSIFAKPDEGILVVSNDSIPIDDTAIISLNCRSNSTDIRVAAIGFDGEMASNTVNYTNPSGNALIVDGIQEIDTSFLSHTGNIIPAFQVYNGGETPASVTITKLDTYNVDTLIPINDINLGIDGSVPNLDGWIGDLLQSGAVGPMFSSENHSQTNSGSLELRGHGGISNAAISIDLNEGRQVYECYVKRFGSTDDSATFVLIVTDGEMNTFASFISAKTIPTDRWIKIMCSSTVHAESKAYLVVQSAGADVFVDDLSAYYID